ncbi:MAG: hypothetical protein K1000chlam3_00435 [Chlamydiae bacterium]|nr:hypothetical protein [Chlamydiota bacterium]
MFKISKSLPVNIENKNESLKKQDDWIQSYLSKKSSNSSQNKNTSTTEIQHKEFAKTTDFVRKMGFEVNDSLSSASDPKLNEEK